MKVDNLASEALTVNICGEHYFMSWKMPLESAFFS